MRYRFYQSRNLSKDKTEKKQASAELPPKTALVETWYESGILCRLAVSIGGLISPGGLFTGVLL
jgi:hypothetical protein